MSVVAMKLPDDDDTSPCRALISQTTDPHHIVGKEEDWTVTLKSILLSGHTDAGANSAGGLSMNLIRGKYKTCADSI